MKNSAIILCMLFSFALCANAYEEQQPLSKKETKEFVANVKSLLVEEKYEEAILYVEECEGRIVVKNIAKADRSWWEDTQSLLAQKQTLFDQNHSLVFAASALYDDARYWDCDAAVGELSLDKTNASHSALREFKSLQARLERVRPKMQEMDANAPGNLQAFAEGRYESLFPLLEISDAEQCVRPELRSEYADMLSSLKESYSRYKSDYKAMVLDPRSEIRWGKFSSIGHTEAKRELSLVNYAIGAIKSSSYNSECYPRMAEALADMLPRLEAAKPVLQKRIQETDPRRSIMGGSSVSRALVVEDCVSELPDLLNILSLNVSAYYGKSFKTELQRKVFEESDEYQSLLSQLKAKREEVLRTVYCCQMNVDTGSYSVDNSCFYLKIGTNKGMSIPFLNILDGEYSHAIGPDGSKVVLESMPVATMWSNWVKNYYSNGDSYHEFALKIPVSASKAVDLENTECELVVCFIPEGVKRYDFTVTEVDGAKLACHPFSMWKKYAYSTSCRIFLFSPEGKLIFDKLYK